MKRKEIILLLSLGTIFLGSWVMLIGAANNEILTVGFGGVLTLLGMIRYYNIVR
jgi:hypothetical protein